ncbi:MAG: hypothetical protein JST47_07055 [Bacteroidetes bacterium]|nr:hypothetical protein [Bacteroidota bacterium]
MKKILLIKTGAAGDIARTSVLLNVPGVRITWVIKKEYTEILPDAHPRLDRIVAAPDAMQALKTETFDITLSLEEDLPCAILATRIPTKKLVGIYCHENSVRYTEDAAGWFDMSLVSALGASQANILKMSNQQPYQYWLFKMAGLEFKGEGYCIYKNKGRQEKKNLIGIEKRVGQQWPNKSWHGYDQLGEWLASKGFLIKMLAQRKTVRDYFDDIAVCSHIISGDTLAMHVALAYKVPCVAIFNCTSPSEIYDYGIMKKVISPLLEKMFYKTTFNNEAIEALSIADVRLAFEPVLLL